MGFLEGGKVTAEWEQALTGLTSEWQRLACNLAVIAAETLPRGGRIALRSAGARGRASRSRPPGIGAGQPGRHGGALEGRANSAELNSRTIHGYVTAKFAEQLGAAAALSDSGPSRALFVASGR